MLFYRFVDFDEILNLSAINGIFFMDVCFSRFLLFMKKIQEFLVAKRLDIMCYILDMQGRTGAK
jgi:hypothetical protein